MNKKHVYFIFNRKVKNLRPAHDISLFLWPVTVKKGFHHWFDYFKVVFQCSYSDT